MNCTRANYKAEIDKRYTSSLTCRDAMANWADFELRSDDFKAWLKRFRKDPCLNDGRKSHNPSGTLSEMVWVMQVGLEPDKSCLLPCLDFEERYQKVFIRRGLTIYLTLLLKDMESEPAEDPRQLVLTK